MILGICHESIRTLIYDHSKLGLWTLPVERKGADEHVVNWVASKMEECGYSGTPLTLKSDQEPAMMSLKRAIAIRRRAETPLVESPVRESKSNGKIERAIRRWQGQFRTLRHNLEGRLGTKLENKSVLIEWLIVWTADILTKYAIHPNGRTSYEMYSQHACKHMVLGFGEKVNFQYKVQHSERDALSNSKSGVGYFIGIVNRNTSYLISTLEGIVAVSTIGRLSDDLCYDRACLTEVTIKYSDYVHGGARTAPVALKAIPASAPVVDANPIKTTYVPRKLYLKPRDFLVHGYTPGCRGCEWLETGNGQRQNHTTECRDRMEALLASDGDGQQRLQEAKDRQDLWISKQKIEEDKVEEAGKPAEGVSDAAADPPLLCYALCRTITMVSVEWKRLNDLRPTTLQSSMRP